jgi:hypothetical protein
MLMAILEIYDQIFFIGSMVSPTIIMVSMAVYYQINHYMQGSIDFSNLSHIILGIILNSISLSLVSIIKYYQFCIQQ